MSATRFLHTYINVTTVTCLAATSVIVLTLRSVPRHNVAWAVGASIFVVLVLAGTVRACLAWHSAYQAGNDLPRKLNAVLTTSAAVALWGGTFGGILVSIDHPPYRSALDEATNTFYAAIRAQGDMANAKTVYESYTAEDEYVVSYWRCKLALEELRSAGPKFRLAVSIFFIGFIAALVTLILVPIACFRSFTTRRRGQRVIPATI